MKHIFLFISCAFIALNVSAQMSIEEINHRLDTRPYFRLGLPYDTIIHLPDSVQEKFAKALNREISEPVLDSLVSLTDQQKENTLQNFKQKCKEDSLCVQQMYQEYLTERKEGQRKMYENDIMPTKMILRAANWNITKAIPVLEKAIGNEKYDQTAVLMALAKLGNDSIKQVLIDKYTLPHILATTKLDTINDEHLHYKPYLVPIKSDTTNNQFPYDAIDDNWKTIDLLHRGFDVAMYLKNKEILLNLVDLIYIKGRDDSNIGISYTVSWVVSEFDNYNYFHNYPNFEVLRKICKDYASSIWHLEDKKLNKKEKKELQTLLSTEYRNKIREQLREWIIENVNFE